MQDHRESRWDDFLLELARFVGDRDWGQFHNPRDLGMSVAIELGELLEHFQWRSDEVIYTAMESDERSEIEAELADVFIYLVRLADVLGVDLLDAAERKLAANARRYPAEEVRGSADKRP
jgi:dCTP diphosphatase